MKPRLHFVLPPRGNLLPPRGSRARLPFVLVPVLAGMAAVQLAWPERIELPPGGSVARIGVVALPAAPPAVIAPPLLASRELFAPSARHGGPESVSDPLDGAVIAGVVQKGRLRLGVIQQASGQVNYIGVGGNIAGWRLAALDQAQARLTHGPGQDLLVTYGLHPSLPKTVGVLQTSVPPGTVPQIHNFASPQTIESGQ